jgi:hypothetical protein
MPVVIKRRVVRKPQVEVTSSKVRTKQTLGAKRMSTKEAPMKSRISLWDVESDNDKAPVARGTIQLTAEVVEELMELINEGEEYVELGVSIWTSDSDNEKAPTFTGLVKSPSERAAEIEAAKAKQGGGSKKSGKMSTRRNK